MPCKTVTKPVCENSIPPVRIYDETGCCFHYECKCVCSGWGDPHYSTFDGKYYSFQENCTYVLVKEIIPRYNITIHIDNENCDPSGSVTCAKALLVFYKNYKITLVLERAPKTRSLVYINNKQIVPAYSNDDLRITSTGIKLVLSIPAIDAIVKLEGFFFSVQLPLSSFHSNTEGQCGYCDNNQENDCRLPNGQIHPSCSGMGQWQVNDTNKPYCHKLPPPTKPPSTSSPRPTCKASICEILISKVFEECHKVIPVDNFYAACQYDVCHTSQGMGCSSLELYASKCSEAFICVAWRNATNGLCEYKCPATKVYKPCERGVEPTCNARYNIQQEKGKQDYTGFQDGCYCPEGKTLFSSNSDICVTSCCTGPSGEPKEVGDTWQSGCKQCVCDKVTMSVQCVPLTCPTQEPITCNEEGYVLVNRTVDCCERHQCECVKSRCSSQKCKLGFELNIHNSNDSCCPACVPKGVCVFDETEYRPGKEFSKNPCESCRCTETQNTTSQLNIIECRQETCNKTCPEGYVYEDKPGQCCGSCKRTSCILMLQGFTSPIIIQPSQSWSPPNNNCTKYDCQKVKDEFRTSVNHIKCPEFDPENCVPGTEQTDANGCCKSCTPRHRCVMKKNTTVLKTKDCESVEPVEMTACQGSCGLSSSMYVMESNRLMHSCTCCQVTASSEKKVKMKCSGGKLMTHSFISADKCGCKECS